MDSAPRGHARKIDWSTLPSRCPAGDGVWRITGHAAARAVLRSHDTVQAGFGADQLARLPSQMRQAVLFQDGPWHREQRRQIARFFTAKRVDAEYLDIMNRLADNQIGQLVASGSADLDKLGSALAVEVAATIIGLTNSRPGMVRRLERFFAAPAHRRTGPLGHLRRSWRKAVSLLSFYRNDVRPAIQARRRRRADDMISYLVDSGRTRSQILTECVTFAPAGMITTREFISLAAWHLLTDDVLRERYRTGEENERMAILQELLRLEPVVGTLKRRTTTPVEVPGDGGVTTIPAGCLVEVSLADANVDPVAIDPVAIDPVAIDPVTVDPVSLGSGPHTVRTSRPLDDGVKGYGLSFGDGPHKCPGAHIALRETDIFLHKLFALDGLRLVVPPTVGLNEEVGSYELSGLQVSLEPHR